MAGTSVVLALSGGVGAAVGASLGQLVQWWREHVRLGVEERHRKEDRDEARAQERRASKRTRYEELATQLTTISKELLELQSQSQDHYFGIVNRKVEDIARHANDARETFSVYADAQLREALIFLSSCVFFVWGPYEGTTEGSYVRLLRSDNAFKLESTKTVPEPDRLTKRHECAMTSADALKFCVDWCVSYISFDLNYSDAAPEPIRFTTRVQE